MEQNHFLGLKITPLTERRLRDLSHRQGIEDGRPVRVADVVDEDEVGGRLVHELARAPGKA